MERKEISNLGNLIWLLDDVFDPHLIEKIEEILNKHGYDLITTRSNNFKHDYAKYGDSVKGILLQVGFPLGEEAIGGLKSCRIISVTGIGIDSLDVNEATKYGIVVTNVPAFCVDEVSDHALTLILALNRRLPDCQNMTKSGLWDAVNLKSIRRLKGQVLGIIGFGKIGRLVAKKAKCFGLQVKVYDPYISKSEVNSLKIKYVGFDELVSTADYISLHLPLNKETYHMINSKVFNSMKKTAYLINVSRGEIVDESALINALKTERIAGAGLDVLSHEPPEITNPLLSMKNVIVTPHSAFISEDSLKDLIEISTKSIVDFFEGKKPENIINPQVLKNYR